MTLDTDRATVSTFHDAVSHLSSFADSTGLLGPNFGVAIAVLLHRHDPERFVIGATGPATSTTDLQVEICDPTWAKVSEFLPPNATGPIHKPFTESFKGRSPKVNNWRHSFDIQGGIGCSAPLSPTYLQSTDFIAEHRFDCSFRDQLTGHCGAAGGDAVCFNPRKKGPGIPAWSKTTARHRPKLLRRGTDMLGNYGHWSVAPTVDSLADLLGDPDARVPAQIFATVLFAGSPYWSSLPGDHSASRLQTLLALSDEEFFTLFSGPVAIKAGESPIETATAASFTDVGTGASAGTSSNEASKPGNGSVAKPVDYVPQDPGIVIELASREPDPERRRRLLENATRGHRRVLNVLAGHLKDCGYAVKEQAGGYDLHAFDGNERHLLFEAKTWTPSNLASQVRSGRAQLEEYAYRNQAVMGDSPELVLALNQEPPRDFWAWEWFESRNAPYVLWLNKSTIETFDHHEKWLADLIGGESV